MKQILQFALLMSGLLMASTATSAENHTVKGVGVQFKPEFVFADKGDFIAFRNMPTHFVDTVRIPDGAEKMISKMGANYDYKVEKEGVYLYKCPPHWGARMGGLIIVGDNLKDKETLIEVLSDYQGTIKDSIGQGYLKKLIKNIKKGKIKIPG